MAAAGLAENDQSAEAQEEGEITRKGISVTGGIDHATAFFFRGYLQANSALIVQPYLNVFVPCPLADGAVVRPYVSLFNSSHFGANDRMSGMSDAMVGAITTWRGLVFDARYAFYNTTPTMNAPTHELGSRLSYDLLTLWQPSGSPFGLRPFAGLYGGWFGETVHHGRDYVYVETGIEPTWRFEAGGRRVGLGLPVTFGLSLDGYYFDSCGCNQPFGYFSTGPTASISLPTPAGCGEWYLNLSAQYLYLAADNLAAINGGRRNAFAGKVGVGFVY